MIDPDTVSKNTYVRTLKKPLLDELSTYPAFDVGNLLYALTGREDMRTANLFCLALMCNILKRRARKKAAQ